jgi:rhamnulokinase
VGGLWLLQECLRDWAAGGRDHELAGLLAEAGALPAGGPRIDVDDPSLIPPGDMPARIRAAAAARDQPPPESPTATVRCIVDSLAASYATTADRALALSGGSGGVVHVVGGGARNTLLCQLTADMSGRSVVAGPAEATSLGNILVQARAAGAVPQELALLRRDLAQRDDLVRYQPRPVGAR